MIKTDAQKRSLDLRNFSLFLSLSLSLSVEMFRCFRNIFWTAELAIRCTERAVPMHAAQTERRLDNLKKVWWSTQSTDERLQRTFLGGFQFEAEMPPNFGKRFRTQTIAP